jgi:hypothetical protein
MVVAVEWACEKLIAYTTVLLNVTSFGSLDVRLRLMFDYDVMLDSSNIIM